MLTLPFSDSFIPFLETTLREAFTRANAANDLLWKMQNDPIITEKVLALQTRTAGLHQQLVRSCTAVLRYLTAPAGSGRSRSGVSPNPTPCGGGLGGEPATSGSLSGSPTQNSDLHTPASSSPTPQPPTPVPPSGSAPYPNSRNFEKILEKIPHDLAWRPSKDRLLCRRQVDVKQKAEFSRLAGKHVLLGPTWPGDDGWPLEAKDWMLAADIFDRKKDKLPIPTAWEVVKIRNWLESFTRLGGGDPNLKKALRDKLPALEAAWREELQAHFSRPEDEGTLTAALQAFNL